MKATLAVYKPLGLTPLQIITLLKQQYPKYESARIGYAGRLDPLAEGVLLLLLDDENRKHKKYEDLPKVYEFEVLFGMSTDSYDTLGLIRHTRKQQTIISTQQIEELLPHFLGKQQQIYPPFSSKTVGGIPLYKWARDGKIEEIILPQREIEITSLELLTSSLLPLKQLQQTVLSRIEIVAGDFRQDEIRSSWQTFLNTTPLLSFPLFRFRISCSSGTYVRAIAQRMGEELGAGALAYSIKRTAVGNFTLHDCLRLEVAG